MVKVQLPSSKELRTATGTRFLRRAEQWARKNGKKLLARDKKMVEEARNQVDAARKSGKQSPMRLAAKLPGRWFAERRLALGDAFTEDPERIRHEAKKDNLWLNKES